ncbi:DUF4405 domain-containing protein [Deferribacter autotrophicus]|uniref:DUF4405 domain-containing protein n=1 Tax=Deferribacter autotrophicus TaxID=500465 RepID=A0A5A8F6M2_9BACT|nr:DUF4405 domain-containing protein [Deferribacter autotrophicus]KAA0259470.1 DUF4405 domain-containing protein [Deferribacter autotrophicus]
MFSLRKITSLVLLLSFLMLVYTGVMLYIAPQGRVAYWAIWKFAGLTKTEYTNIHIMFSIIFLISGILHIYYNWKAILHYLKNKSQQLVIFTPNFVIALLLTLITFLGTYYNLKPFSSVITFSDNIKTYWEKVLGTPPISHGELLSLENFCKKFNIDLQKAESILKENGIKITSVKDTLKTIAITNNTTPQKIYDLIKDAKKLSPTKIKNNMEEETPTGLGRLTLKEMCDQYNINFEMAKNILKEKGFEFDDKTKIKDISVQKGMLPVDIYKMLKK